MNRLDSVAGSMRWIFAQVDEVDLFSPPFSIALAIKPTLTPPSLVSK
jgi:hypothetical protein